MSWCFAAHLGHRWVIRDCYQATGRLLRPRGPDKLIWAVNLALLFAMTLCVASGIAISRVARPELGLATVESPFWFRLHALTAEVTVGLVPVHVALRWRWIAGVGRRLLAWCPASRPAPGERRSGTPGLMAGDLLKPVNLVVLRHTVFLVAAVMAGVVLLDMGYRRLRRARRAKA